MKSVAYISSALLAMSALTAASPTDWHDWKPKACPEPPKCPEPPRSPFHFTSVYHIVATPDQVVNGTGAASRSTPGQPGAIGYFNYGINSQLNVICYNITLINVTGPYQSLARTATHIHQAARGVGGPPRIALPNPEGDDKIRRSVGCLTGPFLTGILANGTDTGTGFMVKQIEDNPSGFFTDAHTSAFVPGVVRGQFP